MLHEGSFEVLRARHAQMVDRMDQGLIPAQVVPNTYDALWQLVSKALYRTHVEGKLKVHQTMQLWICDAMLDA